MPIYVYECRRHGRHDFFSRTVDPRPERPCQECGEPAAMCVTAPGVVDVRRDWNEKANDYRRDPYTQAKAQLTNVRREALERVERDCDRPTGHITEEAIQVGAREIDKGNRSPKPDLEQRQVADIRRKQREAKASTV